MKIGSLLLKNNLLLAPMQNVTTGPFRRFIRHFQDVGLVCVPMLYTKRLSAKPESLSNELHQIKEEQPISVQLIGNDKQNLINAIEFLESFKFNVLDLNAGCPSKRAVFANEGGALLKDFGLLEDLIKTAVKYSSRPVSLKTRLGFNTESLNLDRFANIINKSGLEFVTIHARAVRSRFNDSLLDLTTLKMFRERIQIPIIGNGDIINGTIAKEYIENINVDGLMIGRESMGNPLIFKEIESYLNNGEYLRFENNKKQMENYVNIYEKYLDEFLLDVNLPYPKKEYKHMELKRIAIWLTKKIENSTIIRNDLSKAKNLVKLKEVLQNYYKS